MRERKKNPERKKKDNKNKENDLDDQGPILRIKDECKKYYPSTDGCYFTIWGNVLNHCALCFVGHYKIILIVFSILSEDLQRMTPGLPTFKVTDN